MLVVDIVVPNSDKFLNTPGGFSWKCCISWVEVGGCDPFPCSNQHKHYLDNGHWVLGMMDFLGSKAPFVLVLAQPWYIPLLWANTKDASISCPLCCCLGKFWPHFPFVTDHFTKIPFYRGWWNGKASHESRIIRHPFKKFIPSGVLEIYIAVRKSHPYIENPFRKNNLVPNILAILFLFWLFQCLVGWSWTTGYADTQSVINATSGPHRRGLKPFPSPGTKNLFVFDQFPRSVPPYYVTLSPLHPQTPITFFSLQRHFPSSFPA